MKNLEYYKQKGLHDKKEIFNYLIETLKDSIYTWDYFVDFKKAISNAEIYEEELAQLSMLLGVDEKNINTQLLELVEKHPKCRQALLLMLALRPIKLKETAIISDMNTLTSENKAKMFGKSHKLSESDKEDFILFFEESGLKEFFVTSKVSNLIDYCKGVEVGMDTNARKNRTGQSMETIVEAFVEKLCNEKGYQYIEQATSKKIKEQWGIDIVVDKIDRRFDFAIKGNGQELTLIEVNFYSGGGSKLKATAGEYKDLYDLLNKQQNRFIWVTDGVGWKTAKTALEETFLYSDYIFNLEMLANNILNELID